MNFAFKAVLQSADRKRARRNEAERSPATNPTSTPRTTWIPLENKRQLLDVLALVRTSYGLDPATVQLLRVLAGFVKETNLAEARSLVIYASNKSISLRMNGISEATIKRQIVRLVRAGLLVRKSSPNGKRYPVHDDTGKLIAAFGLNLEPLLAAAPEIIRRHELMKVAEAELKNLVAENEKLDNRISRAIYLGRQHGCEGNWSGFCERLNAIRSKRIRTCRQENDLRTRQAALLSLWNDVDKLIQELKSIGDGDEFERHLQNQKPDFYDFVMETRERGVSGERELAMTFPPAGKASQEVDVALERVVAICPEITMYGHSADRDWRQFFAVANHVRQMFGIRNPLWDEAIREMGPENAAVAVAAILQKGTEIHSHGGYFRGMVRNAKRSGFSAANLLKGLSEK